MGIFCAFGPGVRQGVRLPRLSIMDLAPTVLWLRGLPVPEDMDGRVLTDLFEPDFVAGHPVLHGAATGSLTPAAAAELSAEDEEALADRLRGMVGERETGNETYPLSLIRALLALPSEERRGMDFVLYATQPERLRLRLNPNPAAPIRRIWPASSLLRIPFAMPAATLADRASLLHVNYVAPPVGSCPHVVTAGCSRRWCR